jgi:hypothetical protein
MTTAREHYEALVVFMTPEWRPRFRQTFENERLRDKIRGELYHFESHLDPRYARFLEMRQMKADRWHREVHDLLVRLGAPFSAIVFTPSDDLYGEQRPLAEAVPDLLFGGVGMISCLPGKLALYVGEDGSNVILLRRSS